MPRVWNKDDQYMFVTMNLFFFFPESVMSFYISTIGQENKMRQHYRYFFNCLLDL